jgi:kynurenine formamidase
MRSTEDSNLTLGEFRELFQTVSNWGRWGESDQRGALNRLTPNGVAAAASLIRAGTTVSLSLPMNTEPGIDNPDPADHHMTMLFDSDTGSGPLRFAKDYIGADYHNDSHTHIDALCHVAFDGFLYNRVPSESVSSAGAARDAIEVAKDGIVGRGVLLDVPRARGVPWLEPGEHAFREDLEAAEREQAVTVRAGDILLIRMGHQHRLAERGAWDTVHAKAGLHPTTALFLSEREIAVLGSDGNSDTAPSTTETVGFPMHALALNAMGVHLLDYLYLEDLAEACARAGRWEFFFMTAPLRIVRGTGSPVNPIAIL